MCSTKILGTTFSAPFFIAPATRGLYANERAELNLVEGAAAGGILYVVCIPNPPIGPIASTDSLYRQLSMHLSQLNKSLQARAATKPPSNRSAQSTTSTFYSISNMPLDLRRSKLHRHTRQHQTCRESRCEGNSLHHRCPCHVDPAPRMAVQPREP